MEFNVLTKLEDWDKLAPEWEALLSQSVNPSPFLAHYYQRLWWQSAGGGEWQNFERELCIITAHEDGLLLGIAPLFTWREKDNTQKLGFIGQVEVSDYLDFIVREADQERFLEALLSFIAQSDQVPAKQLQLANIPDSSASLSILTAIAKAQNWQIDSQVLEVAPYISLAESFETYLAQIDKKQRHEIRRKVRNAEAQAEISLHFVQDPADLEDNIHTFLHLMRQDPGKARFLTEEMSHFFKAFTTEAFHQDDLVFSWLLINGQKSAGYLSLRKNNKLYVYNSCWDAEFSSYSPGWVHLAKLIAWAIKQGLHEVDMMRGDEIYKYRFGGVDRHVLEIRLNPTKSSE